MNRHAGCRSDSFWASGCDLRAHPRLTTEYNGPTRPLLLRMRDGEREIRDQRNCERARLPTAVPRERECRAKGLKRGAHESKGQGKEHMQWFPPRRVGGRSIHMRATSSTRLAGTSEVPRMNGDVRNNKEELKGVEKGSIRPPRGGGFCVDNCCSRARGGMEDVR